MPTQPTPIEALPPTPNPDSDEVIFDNDAFNWSKALVPFRLQLNAVASVTYANAQVAANAASAVAGSEAAAEHLVDIAADQAAIATTKAGEATESASLARASDLAASEKAAEAAHSAALAAVASTSLTATSTTSIAAALGDKVFDVGIGKQFPSGEAVAITSKGAPDVRMFGAVKGYVGADLTVTVDGVEGAGTRADWVIGPGGQRGRDGKKGDAGDLNGGKLLGLLSELKAANITAAATTNVWAAVGNSATLIGVTAVTSFGTAPQAGAKFTLIAGAATPLTNGANLVLPGGVNYTTAVGDRIEIYADSTTVMHVTIIKKDGTAVFGHQYLKVSERYASGTSAGASILNDITQTRTVNTTETNSIPGASVSGNQVILPGGTYKYRIRVPAKGGINVSRAFLYNVTDASYTGVGSSSLSVATNSPNNWDCWISGRFTIATQKSYSIRHYTNAAIGDGLGVPSQVTGQPEVYTEAEFEKVN